ncbi:MULTISPECIES: hypothetical protein [Streptomyces]
MRARDKVAVTALRATLAALDNAEAVPLEEAGVGSTEVARRELSERKVADVVRAEIAERLQAAAELTDLAHAERAAGLRAEAAVLLAFLGAPGVEEPALK